MWGDLHESKNINISLSETIGAGKGNRLFRELGAILHYDVYSFEASENEIWQSESILDIELRRDGVEVDAQDDFNQIILFYLLASRPSSDQTKALNLVSKVISTFNGNASYLGQPFSVDSVQGNWDEANDFLLKEWGEEPGSESLRRMIEENHA
ncbi:MAG: hypothetical protein V7765_06515 [Oleispira sp.]